MMQYSSDIVADRRDRFDRVIVFDLDDTLYLERDYVASGFRAVGRWTHQQIGLDHLAEKMMALFRSGVREQIFDKVLAAAGLPPSPGLVMRMVSVYRQHAPQIALAEDAIRFIARQPERTAFAIITDGYLDAQKRKVRALRVFELGVRLAVCTDRWGRDHWKPSPRAFEYVQAHFAMPASSFVYVGDNPLKDFIAPKRLGWATVQINRESRIARRVETRVESADHQIVTFDELTKVG